MEMLRVVQHVAQARPGMNPASLRQTIRSLSRICEAAKKLGWVAIDTPAAEVLDIVANRSRERVRCDIIELFPAAGEYHQKLYRWALGAWRDTITGGQQCAASEPTQGRPQ